MLWDCYKLCCLFAASVYKFWGVEEGEKREVVGGECVWGRGGRLT